MIKQIKDLSAATLDDLNDNCQFVMDDSNDKTKKVSFNVLKQKIGSGGEGSGSTIPAVDGAVIDGEWYFRLNLNGSNKSEWEKLPYVELVDRTLTNSTSVKALKYTVQNDCVIGILLGDISPTGSSGLGAFPCAIVADIINPVDGKLTNVNEFYEYFRGRDCRTNICIPVKKGTQILFSILKLTYSNVGTDDKTLGKCDNEYINYTDAAISGNYPIVTEFKLHPLKEQILSLIYPVGSIYTTITNSDTCPFEGVDGMHWEKIASGKCLFGADETHNVGSEISAGLPLPTIGASGLRCQTAGSHSHKYYHATPQQGIGYGGSSGSIADETSYSGSHTHEITGTLSLSGDGIYGNSNTVQPPAIAVIFWKRVS